MASPSWVTEICWQSDIQRSAGAPERYEAAEIARHQPDRFLGRNSASMAAFAW
jgi:hypothetical protein